MARVFQATVDVSSTFTGSTGPMDIAPESGGNLLLNDFYSARFVEVTTAGAFVASTDVSGLSGGVRPFALAANGSEAYVLQGNVDLHVLAA